MATLQGIIQSAQGGKAAENLAERFGISSEQANAAIQALAPALSMGLQRAIQNPASVGAVIGQLNGPQHEASYQSSESAHSDSGVAGGSTILSQIFGDPNVTGQIAQQASRITGLRPELLARMMPVIATMVAGGLMSALKSQGFSNILSQLGGGKSAAPGGEAGANGGLGAMLSSMLGGLFGAITGQKAAGGSTAQQGLDALIKMLQPAPQADTQHAAALAEVLNRRT